MRQLFVSYAREHRLDVDELVRHLNALGYQAWVDSSLRGGQSWWEEILQRIAECDVFVAIVSDHTLNSVACKRELEWALALNKPVLPVAVERLPDALPRALSTRQIVDYSQRDQEAAFALAGALGTLPPAPPQPEKLPEPPAAPLSYLSDLVEHVGQSEPLTHELQRQIIIQLQPALRSGDAEERRGGRYVLDMFSKRDDLYADVDRNVAQLLAEQGEAQLAAPHAAADEQGEVAPTAGPPGRFDSSERAPWAQALIESPPTGAQSAPPDGGPGSGSPPTGGRPDATPQYFQGGGWSGPPGQSPQQPSVQPAWNQPSPSRKRNPWPLVGTIAAAVVVVVVGLGIALGTRKPHPPPPAKTLTVEQLNGVLLSAEDVNAVMGATSMQPGNTLDKMDSAVMTLSDENCRGALFAMQAPAYAGSGESGVRGQVSNEPGDTHDHWVNQAAVSFPSADKAGQFLQNMVGKWNGCAGQTITVTNDKGKRYRWTVSNVSGRPPKISLTNTQEAADNWSCQRVLNVSANVVIDVNACGYHISNQGSEIADKIVAKVTHQ